MDNYSRVHILAAYFRISPEDLKKRAKRLAKSSSKQYGAESHVDNLFRRSGTGRGTTVGGKYSVNPQQSALFDRLSEELCQETRAPHSSSLNLNSPPGDFLDVASSRVSQMDVIASLRESVKALVDRYSNQAISEALSLPEQMQISRSQLQENLKPWLGRYALYRFSSTRTDEIELSEELLEIEMGDTSTCRLWGHGGGEYQGTLVYSEQAFTSILSHQKSKIDNHVYFFLSLATAPVKGTTVYHGNLTMRSDYSDHRFYQIILVKKDDYFSPRGKNIIDHEIFLKIFHALSQTPRVCTRHEGEYQGAEVIHPVLTTNRGRVNELLGYGDLLFSAYCDNTDAFDKSDSNMDVLLKVEDILESDT